MKSKNKKKRDFFRALVVLWLIVLGLELILKLCGYAINDWLFVVDSILLIICCVLFKNYDQAVKEDKTFGNK